MSIYNSIYDNLTELTIKRENTQFNKTVCEGYEAANDLFEQLVKDGMAEKRGYQLMPTDNRINNDLKINHSNK